MTVVVRSIEEADFQAAADLTATVYIGEGFSPERARATLRDVVTRATHATVLVAFDDSAGDLVGTATLVPPGTPSSQIAVDGEVEIRLVAVSPAARGRSVGESLIRKCITDARATGARTLVLSTQPTMEAAQRLYGRLGFTRQPARDWARPDGPEMLVYVLALTP